ncbi:NAD(P)H-dependent oxidoreductase [Hyphobacterium sp. HN65]|uniref:FMN dependent NADH:quinone oxidoreductase n=1 Tax=Hyphobacterium lacteum TaxID=3116575 RepID=A0ABU7LPC7_9PROT|nr:NAD(P)H-dependent oxidoreductase [Hyphobacterium sp. HN65]MEE2525768.1 NAD(P)H-dependent oxidoreductase [Hyphobacterium sp. HN65]
MSNTLLRVDASMRKTGSRSRAIADRLVEQLSAGQTFDRVIERDLTDGVPFVDEAWIDANFTDPAQRTDEQNAVLSPSDAFVSELKDADTLVIATPIYNFGVPAALKAWVDMIARARVTFRYTPNGPEGLLSGKTAYVVVVSGGTPIDSGIDFATPYIRQALKFVGITDVTVVASSLAGTDAATADASVREALQALAA